MEHPVSITFRGVEPTDVLKEAVETRAEKLEKFYDKIESCQVVVETPHRHHRQGNTYHVRIRLTVPGDEIVVSREPKQSTPPHEDAYLAINDAFKEAKRQLEDYVRQRRRQVKQHVESPHAFVARIFSDERYGFLHTPSGNEIYFHANSVLDGAFDKLEVGAEVRFTEEAGDKGPQASTVVVVGKP